MNGDSTCQASKVLVNMVQKNLVAQRQKELWYQSLHAIESFVLIGTSTWGWQPNKKRASNVVSCCWQAMSRLLNVVEKACQYATVPKSMMLWNHSWQVQMLQKNKMRGWWHSNTKIINHHHQKLQFRRGTHKHKIGSAFYDQKTKTKTGKLILKVAHML